MLVTTGQLPASLAAFRMTTNSGPSFESLTVNMWLRPFHLLSSVLPDKRRTPTISQTARTFNSPNATAPNLGPDFEVKLLLNPSEVLKSDDKLKDVVKAAFSVISGTMKMDIQFVDTKNQIFYKIGWSLRIRKTEGDDSFESTYKKRYLIGEEVSITAGGNIDAAVKDTGEDGYDSTTPYNAQIEVGYQKQTLSISHDENIPLTAAQGMDLPLAEGSQGFLVDKAPDKFKAVLVDHWETKQTCNSKVYGPVYAQRSKGTWNGDNLFIEVWPFRKSKTDERLEPVVEASVKTNTLEKAREGKAKLGRGLRDEGWFLAQDSLRRS